MRKLKRILWVAFAKMIKGGYHAIADQAAEMGFTSILMRAGQGGWNDPACTKEEIAYVRKVLGDEGAEAWIFSDPPTVKREVEAWKKLQDAGIARGCIDAEQSWETNGDFRDVVKVYDEALEASGVTMPMDHAPWPWILGHTRLGNATGFPAVEFCQLVNRRGGFNRAQCYPTEIGVTMQVAVDRMIREWDALAARWKFEPRLAPAFTTYGKKEIAAWGGPSSRMSEVSVSGLEYGIDKFYQEPISFYSREAAAPEVLKSLKSLIASSPIEPGLQLGDGRTDSGLPIGWVDRLEQENVEQFNLLSDAERCELRVHYCRNMPA